MSNNTPVYSSEDIYSIMVYMVHLSKLPTQFPLEQVPIGSHMSDLFYVYF